MSEDGFGHVHGVCKITSNEGSGEYKVTQLWWNPTTTAWDAAVGVGLVTADARDFQNRATASAGTDPIRFWTQEKKGGGYEVLIDIDSIVNDTGISMVIEGILKVTQTGTITIDSRDWRGDHLEFSYAGYSGTLAGLNAFWMSGGTDSYYWSGENMALEKNLQIITAAHCTGKFVLDGTDGGKIKFICTAYSAPSNYWLPFRIRATVSRNEETHTL